MLKVRTEKLGDVAVIHLRGSVVVGSQLEMLRKDVTEQLDRGTVILDLAHVSRIDAAGLGVLLELREKVQSKGGEFRLTNVTRLVRQVLKITKLDTVFENSSRLQMNTPEPRKSQNSAHGNRWIVQS